MSCRTTKPGLGPAADAFLSDFGTSDVPPSMGTHIKNYANGNGNGRCPEVVLLVQASMKML